jgi:hypothetical protein
MAFGSKPEAARSRARDVGIKPHMVAKRMQLSREVEEVKPPGGRDRNIESSRHRRVFSLGSPRFPLIRVAASR